MTTRLLVGALTAGLALGCGGDIDPTASTPIAGRLAESRWLSPEALPGDRPPGLLPEVQVTSTPIIDFEFDWGRDGSYCPTCNQGDGNNRFTFTDRDNDLWVAHVDTATGAFVPQDGMEELVDTRGAYADSFGNGPEWLFGTDGSRIVYTQYRRGLPIVQESGSLGLATQFANGWRARGLAGGFGKQSPMGTVDPLDSNPLISYQDFDKVYWREVRNRASEHQLDLDGRGGGSSRRWVLGTHKLIFTNSAAPDANGVVYPQVFLYDSDTDQAEQLTFDAAAKDAAFMWQAPEYGNEYVFFTIYNQTSLAVYRNVDTGGGKKSWKVSDLIAMPSDIPNIWSPEQFVYKGRSWIFLQLSTSKQPVDFTVPTQLAMTGIDPTHPNFRMLTNDNDTKRVRSDPEYYVTADGPYVYYNRYIPTTDTQPGMSEGVFRVDTYLGPP